MGQFLIYLLESSVLLTVFYLFNRLLLSRDTFHKLNRVLWLGIIFTSLLLPLAELNTWDILRLNDVYALAPSSTNPFSETSSVSPFSASTSDKIAASLQEDDGFNLLHIVQYLFYFYLLGAVIILIIKLIAYVRLSILILPKGNLETTYQETLQTAILQVFGEKRKIKLIVHDRGFAAFSWMNVVVISRKDLIENGKYILVHELSHIKQGHSWDMLLADVLIVFQWFNPASWLLKRSLSQVHEYSVDDLVLETGLDAKSYQMLLIKKAVGQRLYPMTNSFNHNNLKNRITMMLKNKSNSWAYAKCLYVLPIAFAVISTFCAPKISAKMAEISSVKVSEISLKSGEESQKTEYNKTNISNGDFTIVRGGVNNIINGKYINKKKLKFTKDVIVYETLLRYEDAVKKYGSIFTKELDCVEFITKPISELDKDSQEYKTFVLKEYYKGLVFHNGKDLTNRPFEQTLNITIYGAADSQKLSPEDAIIKYGENGKYGAVLTTLNKKPDPLFILDGKEVTKEVIYSLENTPTVSFEYVERPKATSKYRKETNGVLIIKTK